MPTALQLREERANIWSQMCEVHDRPNRTGEDDKQYDALSEKYDDLDRDIEREEKHEKLRASNAPDRSKLAPPRADGDGDAGDDSDYDRVFLQFLRDGLGDLEPDDRKLLRSRFRADKEIKNAAGVGSGAAGGYMVPPAFRDAFIETLKWFGPMLDLAEVIETDTGANMPWATNDDTGNEGALLAENTQDTEQDLTFGTNSLDAYMYTSKIVRVSLQLMQDKPDADVYVARKLGERVGRILNRHWTVGTGSSQPDGIVTSATVGVTGTAGDFAAEGIRSNSLVDLVESIDPAYGALPDLGWMMHQTARKAVRKLKDANGQYVWQPGLTAGVPAELLNYPVRINNHMPTLAVGSKSVLFGSVRTAYVIRIVRGLTVLRLQERYADFLQAGFIAFERADGTMQDGNAVRVLQTAAS